MTFPVTSTLPLAVNDVEMFVNCTVFDVVLPVSTASDRFTEVTIPVSSLPSPMNFP